MGKPVLAIRRPPQTRDHEHLSAAASAVHNRIVQAERKARGRRIIHALGNLISILVLLMVLAALYLAWCGISKHASPIPLPASVTAFVTNVVDRVLPPKTK